MDEDKPLKVGDIIRKFSSQSDLNTDNQLQTAQRFKTHNTVAHGSPLHSCQVTHAQVAKTTESPLEQNVSSKPTDVNETTKKRPQISSKPLFDRSPFTENKIKNLEKASKDQKSTAVFSEITRRGVQIKSSLGTQGKTLTQSAESQEISTALSRISPRNVSHQRWEEASPNLLPGFHGQLKGCNRNSVQGKVVSMFDDLMKIIESEEYDSKLRQCLEKASPNYMTYIAKRKKDILKSDHGIVVAGETSAGKSTLINRIVGMRIFKGRNMESTSTVCKIRNSDKVVVKTELDNGEVEVKDMDDIDIETKHGEKFLRDTLKNLTDMTIVKGTRKYKSVDIGMPVSFLKGNTIMVDTPGIGGSGKVTQKVMEYLPNAVSFIFVINVASAGGMQRDRLPEILKSIISLQMDDEMPCFDPRSVIFITNKWDCIKNDPDDSSDDDEVEKTWKKVVANITRNWPSVRKENIFKMNLTDVNREEKSTLEFDKFRMALEKVVKENENIRITEHFRYLCTLLEDVDTGVRTRQKLINKTKDDQERKRREHEMKIFMLKKKCKEKSEEWRQRIERFIQEEANESFKYMSLDIGKERILNPKGWEPIMDVTYVPTTLGDIVEERVDHYIYEKVQCLKVVEEFKNIKDDILDFYKEISFEIEKMEIEWTGACDEKSGNREETYKEESVAPYVAGVIATSPLWFPLLAAGLAIGVAAIPFAAPVVAFLTRDSRKKKMIDKEYEKCKSLFRSKVCNELEDKHADALNKLIRKVTDVMLQRRIKFIEETIKELSENREKIIASQQSLKHLAEKIKSIKDMAEEIKQAINSSSSQ